jgi:hypothetical protein
VCLYETNIPQSNDIQMIKNALHLWKESLIPCPQYVANRLYPEPVRFSYTSQPNYLTIVLVFAPYFHIQFPHQLFLLTSRKMICKNLFSASYIPLDLSTLIMSIKTYRRISIFNQMFQDSNGCSRRVSLRYCAKIYDTLMEKLLKAELIFRKSNQRPIVKVRVAVKIRHDRNQQQRSWHLGDLLASLVVLWLKRYRKMEKSVSLANTQLLSSPETTVPRKVSIYSTGLRGAFNNLST